MTTDNVQQIIGRAVTDTEFRELLFSDAEKALEGYDLSDEEIAILMDLPQEQFDSMGSELEERISKVSGTGGYP